MSETGTKTDRKEPQSDLLKHQRYLEALDKAAGILLNSISEIKFDEFLAVMGFASQVDRVLVILKKTEPNGKFSMPIRAQWNRNENIKAVEESTHDFFIENVWAGWEKTLARDEPVCFLTPNLPENQKNLFNSLNVKALLALPIIIDDRLEGFISFDNCTEERQWTTAEIEFLHTAAENLASTIKHIETRKELKEQRDFAQRLIETAQTIILVLDKDANIVTFNPYFEKLSGWRLEEVKGKNWFDTFLPEEDREAIKQVFQKAINDIRIDGNINSIVTKYGRLRQIEWFSRTLRDSRNKTIGVLSTGQDITERLNSQQAVKDSEAKFKTIFDGSLDGILLADIETKKFHMHNKMICKMLGYTEEEISHLSVNDIHPAKDLPQIIEIFESQARGEIKLGENMPVKRKDGSVFYADINTSPITLSGKKYLMGSFRDTTERKKAEEELRKSEATFKSVTTAVPVGLGFASDRTIHWANDYLLQLVGRQKEEIIGKDSRIFYENDEGYNFVGNQYYKELRETGMSKLEVNWKHKNGKIINILLTGVALNKEDVSQGIVFAVLDITERKQAEENLKKSRKVLQDMIDAMPFGVMVVGKDKKIKHLNAVAQQLSGYSEKELLGQLCHKTLCPAEENACPILNLNQKLDRSEKKLITKDGRQIPIFKSVVDLNLGGEDVLLEAFVDITERKKAEEDLKKAHEELEQKVVERTMELQKTNVQLLKTIVERDRIQKVLQETEKLAGAGKLAAQIAHEINNPLAGIKNSFLLIKDAIPANHKYFEYVGRIEKEINRVSQIVKQMFDLYRPGTTPLKTFRLYDTIKDITELLKAARQEKKINMEINCDEKITVTMPEALLRQVVFNIVQNAIQATGSETTVKINASTDDGRLKLSVSDQGAGIDERIKNRIFEPFFTTGLGGPESGLGLGLAITKDIINAMNGEISFISEKNKGTIFNISIPIE